MRAAFVAQKVRNHIASNCASGGPLHDLHQAAIGILPVPRRDPLEMMVLLVFLPICIILVPVSAC